MLGHLRLLRVVGPSMLPTLSPGDLLLARFSPPDRARRPGRVVVLRLPPGPAGPRPLGIKRLGRRDDGGWWIHRDNPLIGQDSRHFGEIAQADILAVVWLRCWPRPGRIGNAPTEVG
ncbi:MAG: S24 family peptidase [Angustibacter sp.]